MTAETIDDVRNRTGDWEPDPPADLLQGLTPGVPPTDGDKDRIVDEWEGAHRLDATDPDDHATVMSSGYTAIEEYVNELSVALVGAPPPASQTPVRTGASDTKTTAAGGDNGSDPLAGIALALSIVALVLAGFAVHRVRGGRPPQAPQA